MAEHTTTITESNRHALDDSFDSGVTAGAIALAEGARFDCPTDVADYARSHAVRLGYSDPDAFACGFSNAFHGWAA